MVDGGATVPPHPGTKFDVTVTATVVVPLAGGPGLSIATSRSNDSPPAITPVSGSVSPSVSVSNTSAGSNSPIVPRSLYKFTLTGAKSPLHAHVKSKRSLPFPVLVKVYEE